MRNFKFLVINVLFGLLILPSIVFSFDLKGRIFTVDDKGEKLPLAGATVRILGKNVGTITNADGYFSIETQVGDKLIISFVGFNNDTIDIKSNTYLEVVLKGEIETNEVLVEEDSPETFIEPTSITKTEVITQSGLKKAACCNLSESFVTNPSVDVTFTDAITGAKQIQLLGLAQNYTQILLERAPGLQGLASNYGLLFIPGSWINSISISKGAGSVITGYESITGQICVDFKPPENTEDIHLNLFANNMFRFEGNLIAKQAFSDDLRAVIFLHGNSFKKKIDHNYDGFLDLPLNQQANFLGSLYYNKDMFESTSFVNFIYNNLQAGQVKFFDGIDSSWGSDAKIRRLSIITKNGYILDDESYSSLGSIFSFVHHKQNSFYGKRAFNAEQNSFFTNLIWSSVLHLQSSYYEHEDLQPNLSFGLSLSYNNYIQYLDSIDYSSYEFVPGVYFEYNFHEIENLSIIPGMRFDYHNQFNLIFTPRLHIKYQISELHTFRLTAGKGFHYPLPLVEYNSIFSSSRDIIFEEDLELEEAWNFGLTTTHYFSIFGIPLTMNTEFFHTNFLNRTIVDMDSKPTEVRIYNSKDKSFSNSFQIDFNIEMLRNLSFTMAYRLNDVWMTIGKQLQRKPLQSIHKGFLNIVYSPSPFVFDFTIEYNGGGRLPKTDAYPDEFRKEEQFPAFFQIFSQITYKLPFFEIYLGIENLLDFRQENPIISASQPFSKYFDASMLWGPIEGRKIYLGIRLLKN
ncbi:MAG: TonB-dependent receptor [Ignavibacteria bacterium]|nr:TonB-dependent receptor [Ignavibacteria bacterium]